MNQILSLLQIVISLLMAVSSNQNAALADKKQTLDIAVKSVRIAQVYLDAQKPVKAPPIAPEPIYYHIKDSSGNDTNIITTDNPIKPIKEPILFLEGAIINSKGIMKRIKGINRDSAVKQLRLTRDDIFEQNPYHVTGFYATSSLSEKDKISVSIYIHQPPTGTNWSCKKTTGAYGWTGKLENTMPHTEDFFADPSSYAVLEKQLSPDILTLYPCPAICTQYRPLR